MDREVRISPDGMMVAIRSNAPADDWNAWMVGHCLHGGHWASTSEVQYWSTVTAIETPPQPEPEESPLSPPLEPI